MAAAGAANASKQFITTLLYIGDLDPLRSMRTSIIWSIRLDKWFRYSWFMKFSGAEQKRPLGF
ncbi:hypothetical protein AHAS_Ahas04G0191100 [Arachis hypogaea]